MRHGSEYTTGLLKLLCHGSHRDTLDCLIYAKLIIVSTPKSYMEAQHSS